MINEKDLAIIIMCDVIEGHDWMSFASWYSIQKNVSDCSVYLRLSGSNSKQLFGWARRCGIKTYRKQFQINNPIIKTISPSVMAVRPFDGDFNIVSSKTDIISTFVDYKFGCGNFVLDKWINKLDCPFEKALKRFSTFDLNINELAILNIWEQSYVAYRALGGFI